MQKIKQIKFTASFVFLLFVFTNIGQSMPMLTEENKYAKNLAPKPLSLVIEDLQKIIDNIENEKQKNEALNLIDELLNGKDGKISSRKKYLESLYNNPQALAEANDFYRFTEKVTNKDVGILLYNENPERRQKVGKLKKIIESYNDYMVIAEGNVSFLVCKPSKADNFPWVIKIPKEETFLNKKINFRQLEEEMIFAKNNMGGLIAPLTILKNVTLRVEDDEGVVVTRIYPFVVVQQELAVVDQNDFPLSFYTDKGKIITKEELDMKREMLVEELLKRKILYFDSLSAFNFGIDFVSGEVFLVDHGNSRFYTEEDKLLPQWDDYILLEYFSIIKGDSSLPLFDLFEEKKWKEAWITPEVNIPKDFEKNMPKLIIHEDNFLEIQKIKMFRSAA